MNRKLYLIILYCMEVIILSCIGIYGVNCPMNNNSCNFSTCNTCFPNPCNSNVCNTCCTNCCNACSLNPCGCCAPILPVAPTGTTGPQIVISSLAAFTLCNECFPINNGELIPFKCITKIGCSINHKNGGVFILLAPNSKYAFSWIVEPTICATTFNVGASLKVNGVEIVNGKGTTSTHSCGSKAFISKAGTFTTGTGTEMLSLMYLSDTGKHDILNACLFIERISSCS